MNILDSQVLIIDPLIIIIEEFNNTKSISNYHDYTIFYTIA